MQIPEEPSPCVIKVTNVSQTVNEEKLREFFEFCGTIVELQLNAAGDGQEAIIRFQNAVSANTATMLTKARLQDRTIYVEYYFPQFNGTSVSSEHSESRDYQANQMVSKWLASGMLMSEQVVANGRNLLSKYVEPVFLQAKEIAKTQATKLDQQFHITEKALGVEQKYQLSQKFNSAKNYVVSTATQLHQTAIQNPYGKQANDFVTKTVKTAEATIAESKKIYDSKKQEQAVPPQEPVD